MSLDSEFSQRDKMTMLDIVGGGPFGLEAGRWTDDTSMACCMAYSLLKCNGFDAKHQMERYSYWYSPSQEPLAKYRRKLSQWCHLYLR
jgi:ADP-ribosylglycohydrolase